MRAGVMSAGAFWRARTAAPAKAKQDDSSRVEGNVRPFVGWSPERFASEQIRSLVRRVFSQSATPPVRQVVFSAVDPVTDVRDLCLRVGEMLAEETLGDVAVVGDHPHSGPAREEYQPAALATSVDIQTARPRDSGVRVRGNLWTVPFRTTGTFTSGTSLHRYMGEIRREFEYSVVAAASCGGSPSAISMAQLADGIILVLSAQFTRRMAALRVRDAVESAQIRILGTVLRDREFPIPEGLYRRL